MHRGASLKTVIRARSASWLEETSFLREYLWKYRRYVGIGLLTLVVVDCLEILPPLLLKRSVDVALGIGPTRELMILAFTFLGVSLVQGLCRYGWRMYLIRSSLFVGRDLRSRFAKHLFSLSPSYFDRTPVGELMSLATSDVEAVRMAVGSGLLIFADALFYFMTVPVAMYWLSPRLTLLAFAPLPIVPWLVWRNEREVHTRFEKVQKCFGELSAMVQESLAGVRIIKGFARDRAFTDRFRGKGEEFSKLNLELARVQSAFGPTLDLSMSLGMVLLLFVGGRWMIEGGQPTLGGAAISIGTFVAFQRYIQKMVWPMAAIGMSLGYYQRALSSSHRLKQVFAESSDVPESKSVVLPGLVGGRTAGGIEFKALSFAYPGSSAPVLRSISLRIEPGERVAFVGAVGAGKSALLSLLPRLYPVARGMLQVDGIDINDWPLEELRKQVGFVGQDVFLFSETVAENVAYGLAGWNEVQLTSPLSWGPIIEDSARLASVHDEVLSLSQGYMSRLGERGVNLSGGQKQRLTIARALAKQPSILVLDDALASVDVQTEERILKGLRSRPERNTEVIAAHRISTIRDADRIVMLENGAITQVGSHAQLLGEKGGLYSAFYEQQRLREELESFL